MANGLSSSPGRLDVLLGVTTQKLILSQRSAYVPREFVQVALRGAVHRSQFPVSETPLPLTARKMLIGRGLRKRKCQARLHWDQLGNSQQLFTNGCLSYLQIKSRLQIEPVLWRLTQRTTKK